MLPRRPFIAWLGLPPLLAAAGCRHAPPASAPASSRAMGADAVTPGSDDDTALARLTAAFAARPVVLLGEVHDHPGQHALRVRALRRWIAQGGARPALLMEQVDRERQADLDRARARPGAEADAVIAAAAPPPQGWDWALYRPYVALALDHGLPLVAANVSRADTRRVIADGLAAHGFDAAVPDDLLAAQARAIVQGHCGLIDDAQARLLALAQIARDQFMARLLERHAAGGGAAVLLTGNGHVRADVGVPRWLGAATRARSVSIGLLEAGDPSAGAFDVALSMPGQPRADPCEELRRMPMPPARV